MELPKPPLQSIRYIVICAGGILGFILLAIFPGYRALHATDQKIATLQAQIDEQNAMHPLFQDLLKRAKTETPSRLPFPKKTKLPRDETTDISASFQRLAMQNQFTVQSIVPDVVSLTDGSGMLMLDMVLRGRFADFRRLLLQLGEIPYLERIESIGIQTVENTKQFNLKVWIAQE